MEHPHFKDRPLHVRVISIILTVLVLASLLFLSGKYFIEKREERDKYEKVKEYSKHTKIDDISGNDIYLIILNGDTMGVVSVK